MYVIVLFLIVCFILYILLHVVLKPKYKLAAIVNKLPGHPTYPVIGTLHAFIGVAREDLFLWIIHYVKLYRPLFRSWMGNVPYVHVMKPDHLEVVMKSSLHITKGSIYNELHPWLRLGLLTSSALNILHIKFKILKENFNLKGEKWHARRKMLTPAFHFQILEKFMEIFVEKSNLLVDQLSEKLDGNVFDLYPFITHCTLDIICETAMGVQINAMSSTQRNLTYIKAIYRICELMTLRHLKPLLMLSFLPMFSKGREMRKTIATLHNFSNKVIKERRQSLLNSTSSETFGKKRRVSFLDILLRSSIDGKSLSDQDIREEVDTFMFEGHDTTTAAVCWSLFLLGNHQDIQDKVYKEIKDVLQDKKTPKTLADLSELHYLECVIKEALRMYPSVALIARELTEDITLDGYQIPAGCQLWLHIYDVHRDPEHWDNPKVFDPDRFLPHNSMNRHPYAYIPFSAGPRNCIGQKFAMYEEKTLLASILKNYKVISLDSMNVVKPVFEIILRPTNGVRIKLERR